jgi:flagellar basal-body rod protein FlgF/flagellar basal-body rod protein FlgG
LLKAGDVGLFTIPFHPQFNRAAQDGLPIRAAHPDSSLPSLKNTDMPYGLYISAEGAQAQTRRMEVIANNIANVDTVGFKRDLAVMQSRYAEAIERGTASPGAGTLNDIGGGVQFHQTVTDFSPGPVKKTGNPGDAALRGDGFFVVEKGQERLLTRAGNFRLTPSGDLVTQQGYPVLGEGNAPVRLSPTGGPWEIDAAGGVKQGGERQELQIVKPASLGDLVKSGENLFRPLGDVRPVAENERAVAGGCLEMSAVEPTTEMTTMIETSRLIEANLNVMKSHNEMLTGLIERVLKA